MSISQADPDETRDIDLDDRNRTCFEDPDFEMDKNLAFSIGYGGDQEYRGDF